MGQIAEAVQKYKERLEAAGVRSGDPKAMNDFEAAIRRACVGLDIDLDEVSCGLNPIAIATGQWLEGYIVGRLDAEARLRREGVAGG